AVLQGMTPGAPMSAGDPAEHLAVLRDSLYPAQREMAAEALSACDWQRQPHILEALVQAARSDPAASVRASCCRIFARMTLNIAPTLSPLQALQNAADPRVRSEADQAPTYLTNQPASPSAVQPARAQ